MNKHLQSLITERIPENIFNFKPRGKRYIESPYERRSSSKSYITGLRLILVVVVDGDDDFTQNFYSSFPKRNIFVISLLIPLL